LDHRNPAGYDRARVNGRAVGAIVAAALAAAVAAFPGSGAVTTRSGPVTSVAIFYYAWYGTPQRDGAWQHWGQNGAVPPLRIGSSYYPARGPYSSTDPRVVRDHMREIAAAGIDTVIVSWWGPDSVEFQRFPEVVRAARRAGLAVAAHVEPWPGRTAASVVEVVNTLRPLGVTDYYVYDSAREPDASWAEVLPGVQGAREFANTWLPGKAARGRFHGLYSYDVVVYPAESFARICASARRLRLACAPSVGPGFDATQATSLAGVAPRRDGRRYDHMWRGALRAAPDVVTITSYNEWHEGTQIEAARAMPGYASYDGAWGLTGKAAQHAYLDRTAYWVARLGGKSQ
jgi:hypothetical protein